MAQPVFEYRDYKAYLRDLTRSRGRGEKSRMAEVLRCHLAYVSQVLGGSAQFSPEQTEALNAYLGHAEDEAEFFHLLVSHARAGTQALRKFHEARIRKALHARTVLDNRLKQHKTLPSESQITYYSSWHYAAIHLLISVPGFQTKEQIAQRLRLPLSKVTEVLSFLVSTGLADLVSGRYQVGQVSLHLQNDSPSLVRHHATWRLQALQAVERRDPRELHYTSVVSMSPEDEPEVRKILVDAIEKVRSVVRQSPEREVYCYALDLFPV